MIKISIHNDMILKIKCSHRNQPFKYLKKPPQLHQKWSIDFWFFFLLIFSGHVDPGETELQTALRETEEEAGLKESDFTMYTEFQRTLNYEVQGKPKRVVYWLSELKNPSTPVTLSDEHIDFKWLNLPQALNYVEKYKDFQQVLNDADTFIKSNLW